MQATISTPDPSRSNFGGTRTGSTGRRPVTAWGPRRRRTCEWRLDCDALLPPTVSWLPCWQMRAPITRWHGTAPDGSSTTRMETRYLPQARRSGDGKRCGAWQLGCRNSDNTYTGPVNTHTSSHCA
jgi:hypothetical protein